ncbi:hypothetical protein DTO166G4_7651 [Paecilomyces variotii]|nr:hypothetical protein DTO166G4_7651 [Paecilomyces variotii]KAJ9229152.1 hypothetical protein DTO166G5_8086 [Paecilomyces variotii]KAJ9232500.1 hypothetical protein DTO169E5_7445 [Paecilomyces variotii]KAJ9256435.1 hypothetical protein DTO195F2_5843 [Paecilomyces variotii]
MPPQSSPLPTPTILLPGLPPKTLVGIDLLSFTSTANFHGIRDLPEGWHFLYTGTTESFSLRCGGWFYIGDIQSATTTTGAASTALTRRRLGGADATEIRVWKWNQDVEALVPIIGESSEEKQEAMRYKANLSAIWQSGGLFRYRSRISSTAVGGREEDRDLDDEDNQKEGRSDWVGLTGNISPQLLSRILGDPEVDVDGKPRWTVTSGSTAQRDADQIPGLTSREAAGITAEQEKDLRFLPVDLKRTWREGAIGRERTEAAQDRSWALGDLVRRVAQDGDEQMGERQVLGELQFTFLMVLTLMNYSCLEQWKRLLSLIFTCRAAVTAREGFFTDVLRLLRLQLKRCDDVEGGLFEMDGENGAEFLIKLLTGFKRTVDELSDGVGFAVKFELKVFEKWVKEEFNWELKKEAIVKRGMLELEDGEQVEMEMNDADEEDETGEYAPVIVDLGEREGSSSLELDMKD